LALPFFTALLLILWTVPALAQAQASSKPGALEIHPAYFSMMRVRAAMPEAARLEQLKASAQSQLREDARRSLETIEKMAKEGRKEEEISAFRQEARAALSVKQDALFKVLEPQEKQLKIRLFAAVTSVARAHQVDFVVDSEGVYRGTKKLAEVGLDLTDEIISRLKERADAKSSD